MNDTKVAPSKSIAARHALSVWELPKLLRSVHHYRKHSPKAAVERPHFRAILAFVHRNRFAVASQIRRRFPNYLRSDRTTRRHLTEMEAQGLLSVVDTNNVSPLWPKVYFVTRRGVALLRNALHEKGQDWSETLHDRRRSDGSSAQHVLHEIFLTEFLLLAWEGTQQRDDLEILTTQRRSLKKHPAFNLVVGGRHTRLEPDALFLHRQRDKGMMCCFVELDLGSMTPRQIAKKLARYRAWSESGAAASYLKGLYERHGARTPTTAFRLLFVIASKTRSATRRRVNRLMELSRQLPTELRNRIWFCSVQQLQESSAPVKLLTAPLWVRPRDLPAHEEALDGWQAMPLHPLFN